MGGKRRSLGTSRPPQPQEGFGNLRCSWTSLLQPGLCTGWLRHGESRSGCRLAWDETWCLDSGRWAVFYFHPLKGPIGIWHTVWEFWLSRYAVVIPASDMTRYQADLHLPVMSWCFVGDGRGGTTTRWLCCLWKSKQSQRCGHPSPSQWIADGHHGSAQQELN